VSRRANVWPTKVLEKSDTRGRFEKSARTARRIWSEPRNLYEASSRTGQTSWEADGVSRATWYRRRRLAENGQG